MADVMNLQIPTEHSLLLTFYRVLFIYFFFFFSGCPFRHSDPELLKQKLQVYKVAPSGISQVGAAQISLLRLTSLALDR